MTSLPHGQLNHITIRSGALLRRMRVQLYTPPNYEEVLRYPVVYLLHPWGTEERYWTAQLRFHKIADRLIHAKAVSPFVAVMPQGDKSFWINATNPGGDYSPILKLDPDYFQGALEGYGDYADYFLNDVIPAVERRLSVRDDQAGRAIAGIAMGGAGAATLALSNPGCFGAVGIHSPALFTADRLGPPWIFGLGDEKAFAARDPLHIARTAPIPEGLRIYIDCGTHDEMSAPTLDLHYALTERGIQHTFHSPPRWAHPRILAHSPCRVCGLLCGGVVADAGSGG